MRTRPTLRAHIYQYRRGFDRVKTLLPIRGNGWIVTLYDGTLFGAERWWAPNWTLAVKLMQRYWRR